MKHKLFILVWLVMLSVCFVVTGVLALLGYANAEVYFWTGSPIESEAGKIAWIVISAMCLIVFSVWAARDYRRRETCDPPANGKEE